MKLISLSHWSLCCLIVVILAGGPAFATPVFTDDFSTGLGSWSGIGEISWEGTNETMTLRDGGDGTALAERAPYAPISAGSYRVAFDYFAGVSSVPSPPEVGLLHDFWSFDIVLADYSDPSVAVTFGVDEYGPLLRNTGTHRFEWIFTNPFENASFTPLFLLSNENTTAGDSTVSIMNFELAAAAAPVPEPGTIVLLGGGVIVLSFAWRRRRQH